MDQAEFTTIFEHSYTSLVLYAFRIVKDGAVAEDIAEESFVKLWDKRDIFTDVPSIKSYVYAIARNACFKWIQKNKKATTGHKIPESLCDTDRSALDDIIYAETMGLIFSAFDRLPKQCRKVFVMHYIEEKKIAAISAELGVSPGTVKTQKYRGIKILQNAILGMPLVLIIDLLKANP